MGNAGKLSGDRDHGEEDTVIDGSRDKRGTGSRNASDGAAENGEGPYSFALVRRVYNDINNGSVELSVIDRPSEANQFVRFVCECFERPPETPIR